MTEEKEEEMKEVCLVLVNKMRDLGLAAVMMVGDPDTGDVHATGNIGEETTRAMLTEFLEASVGQIGERPTLVPH